MNSTWENRMTWLWKKSEISLWKDGYSITFTKNEDYKHIVKNTHCQMNLNKNILAFCQLTRISLGFNLSIKNSELMVYEQLPREQKW